MSQITWRNVAAPDFSSAASILAAASNGISQGLNGIGDVVQDVRNRQVEARSAEAIGKLSSIRGSSNVDQILSSVLESTAPGDRNAALQQALLTAQSDAQALDNGRSIIGDRDGRLALANSANARTQTTFDRNIARENQLADLGSTLAGELSSFSRAIDRTESGGGADQYDTLYGHRNRENGVRVSQMTLGQAKEFSAPSGAYGQSVNDEIGRVATPMGKYQIVGSTLRNIQENLQLPDDVQFNPAVQELMGTYLGQQRVTGPRSQEAKRDGLRAEWEGFKNKSDRELDVIIAELEATPPVTRDQIIAAGSGNGQALPAGVNSAEQALLQSIANNPGNLLTPADIAAQRNTTLGITDDRAARADAILQEQLRLEAGEYATDAIAGADPQNVSTEVPLKIQEDLQAGRITEDEASARTAAFNQQLAERPDITSEAAQNRDIAARREAIDQELFSQLQAAGPNQEQARFEGQNFIRENVAPQDQAYALEALDRTLSQNGSFFQAAPNAGPVDQLLQSDQIRQIVGDEVVGRGQVATDLSAQGHLNAVENAATALPYGNLSAQNFTDSPVEGGDATGQSERQTLAGLSARLLESFGPKSGAPLRIDDALDVVQDVIKETGLPEGLVIGQIENSLDAKSGLIFDNGFGNGLSIDKGTLLGNLDYALDANGKADPTKINQAKENVQQMERTRAEIGRLETQRQQVSTEIQVLQGRPETDARNRQISVKYQELQQIETQMSRLAENARTMAGVRPTVAEDVAGLRQERSALQAENERLVNRNTAFANANPARNPSQGSADQIISQFLSTPPATARPAAPPGAPLGADIDAYLAQIR